MLRHPLTALKRLLFTTSIRLTTSWSFVSKLSSRESIISASTPWKSPPTPACSASAGWTSTLARSRLQPMIKLEQRSKFCSSLKKRFWIKSIRSCACTISSVSGRALLAWWCSWEPFRLSLPGLLFYYRMPGSLCRSRRGSDSGLKK